MPWTNRSTSVNLDRTPTGQWGRLSYCNHITDSFAKTYFTGRCTVIHRALTPWHATGDRLSEDDSGTQCIAGSPLHPDIHSYTCTSHTAVQTRLSCLGSPSLSFLLGLSWIGKMTAAGFLCSNCVVRPRCEFQLCHHLLWDLVTPSFPDLLVLQFPHLLNSDNNCTQLTGLWCG